MMKVFDTIPCRIACAVFITFLATACGEKSKQESAPTETETPAFFFGKMKELQIDVYAEPGAEPFEITALRNPQLAGFNILKSNIEALFAQRELVPLITVPASGSEHTTIGAQNRASWSVQAIQDLEKKERKRRGTGTTGNFFVVFLKGYFERDGKPDEGVIGVSLSGTTIIAMFKDVITSTSSNANGLVPKYVEQSTLVHEMGHALGLVNNGVALQSEHHDKEHGAHCSNKDCVMYWLNEGKDAAVTFVQEYIKSGRSDVVLFGSQCLEDTASFKP